MFSVMDLFPNNIYAYNAKCGEILTYGNGSMRYEAINDAANTFLDKLASISRIDTYFLNSANPSCLKSNVKLAQSCNYYKITHEIDDKSKFNITITLTNIKVYDVDVLKLMNL